MLVWRELSGDFFGKGLCWHSTAIRFCNDSEHWRDLSGCSKPDNFHHRPQPLFAINFDLSKLIKLKFDIISQMWKYVIQNIFWALHSNINIRNSSCVWRLERVRSLKLTMNKTLFWQDWTVCFVNNTRFHLFRNY